MTILGAIDAARAHDNLDMTRKKKRRHCKGRPKLRGMAPNNALGNPTAARLRAKAERGDSSSPASVRGRSPGRKRQSAGSDARISSSDGFGAGPEGQSSVLR
jgi:hypothetical protein